MDNILVNLSNSSTSEQTNRGVHKQPIQGLQGGLKVVNYGVSASTSKIVPLSIDATGKLEVASSGGGAGSATSANQVLQLAQETIIAGDTTSLDTKITACDTGAVVVSSSALPSGGATSALQTTGNTSLATIAGDTTSVDGKITACDTGAVVVSSSALPTGGATSALQTTGNTSLATIAGDTTSVDGKITACDTGAVVVSSSALPTGGATSALQVLSQTTSTIFSGTQVIAGASSHTFTTTLDKNGSTKYNLLITSTTTAGDIDYVITVDASDDNSTFYTDANGGGGMGPPSVSLIQNAQISVIDQTSRYARFSILNNSLVSLTITSVKATTINGI